MSKARCLPLILALSALPVLAEGDDQKKSDRKVGKRSLMARVKAAIADRDKDADGRLTAAELGAGQAIFALLDRDGSGFLETQELAALVQRGRRPDRGGRDTLQRLERMDANKDGVITADEWRGPEQLFQRLDRNKDGKLSADEMRRMRRGDPRERLRMRMESIKRMDVNKDGKISKEEWKGAPRYFERMDRNKDGFVSMEELEALTRRMGGRRRGGGISDAIFRRIDKDNNGKVTREEWPLRPEAFDRLDANKDGVLELAEVTTGATDARTPGRRKKDTPKKDAPERDGR